MEEELDIRPVETDSTEEQIRVQQLIGATILATMNTGQPHQGADKNLRILTTPVLGVQGVAVVTMQLLDTMLPEEVTSGLHLVKDEDDGPDGTNG